MRDKETLSKYFDLLPEDVFAWVCPSCRDLFEEPKDLVTKIRLAIATEVTVPQKPPIRFSADSESIEANTQLLRESGYDMEILLARCQGTTAAPGSEFRKPTALQKVFGTHPNWEFFASTLRHGMGYEFRRGLTEQERLAEVTAMIERGNHKSAEVHADKVRALLLKDVTHGFSLAFDPSIIPSIPHALVQPLGIVEQFTLTASGDRKLKHRLTQDLTFSLAVEKSSVNHRIDMEQYPDMFYGFCLQRIAHMVVALRSQDPCIPILMAKYDYSDAYCRISHSPRAVAQSITVFEGTAYAALRLTFGGAPNPPGFCAFSEMVADLANELKLCKTSWDPAELRSPNLSQPPLPHRQRSSVPFGQAARLAVQVHTDLAGIVDCFIDDLIHVFLDNGDAWKRESLIVPLAIHAASRPHAGNDEPIPRRPILSPEKLEAEGTPAESQIVLGWSIDTRRLLIALPDDKFVAWSKDVAAVIEAGDASMGYLDSLIGKLNHAGFVIPLSRHFLSRLRRQLDRGKSKKHRLQLSSAELDDLHLWSIFLKAANDGISLNNIVLRTPTQLCWSDSCPLGLGGFDLNSGRAWRLRIPSDSVLHGHKGVNNLLEFLALAV